MYMRNFVYVYVHIYIYIYIYVHAHVRVWSPPHRMRLTACYWHSLHLILPNIRSIYKRFLFCKRATPFSFLARHITSKTKGEPDNFEKRFSSKKLVRDCLT